MEILVCVKEVPDETKEIHLDPESGCPDLSDAALQANAFDTYAVEMAVRKTEECGGTVTVLSAGAKSTAAVLRNCIAVGAAKGCAVNDPLLENADSFLAAEAVKAAILKLEEENGRPFDVILTGKESTDMIGGEFGGILSEKLNRPLVSDVVEFTSEEAGITVKKELESGYYEVQMPCPAVITVSTPDFKPRYPSIKSKLAARKVSIPEYSLEELELENTEPMVGFEGWFDPPKRAAGTKYTDLSAEDAAAKIMEKIAESKVL